MKVVLSITDTLLALAKNSIGSKTFRNIYFESKGDKKDLAENGNLSCAVFVSYLLYLLKLVQDTHITVGGTLNDMRKSGWIEIKEPQSGCVLVWEEKDFGKGGKHKHLGFYVGNGKAVSNNSKLGCPTQHRWDKFNGRKVEAIFGHPKLYNEH